MVSGELEMRLPEVLTAQELKALDIAGLIEQLGLAQSAIEILHSQKKAKYDELIKAQDTLLDAQKITHKLKVELKDLTNNTLKFLERIKIVKTLIKREKD